MSKFILKPSDRQSIDYIEEERLKSQTNSGKIIHEEDIQSFANKNLSNVTYPTLSIGNISNGDCDRVVESYISSDNRTWYRKWASGWKECGIYYSSNFVNTIATITLPLTFRNTEFTVCVSTRTNGFVNTPTYEVTGGRTINTVQVGSTSTANGTCVYCCGY